MKQKKKLETENQDDKKILKILGPLLSLLLPAGLVFLKGFLRQETVESMLQGLILVGLFTFFVLSKMICDKAETGFYLCLLISFFVVGLCYFLPISGWPFCLVYVLWTLFSSPLDACIYPSLLLVMLPFFKELGGMEWFSYFFLGMVVIVLFSRWKEEKNTAFSLAAFSCSFFICQCVFSVLNHGIRIRLEEMIILIANLLITLILCTVILKGYLKNILEKYTDSYAILNEPTNPLLEQFKESQPKEYMLRIHTAYFCDRIANVLDMAPEPVRCAALYLFMQDKADFPPQVKQIWEEYRQPAQGLIHTDTLILVTSENVVAALSAYIEKNGKKDNYQNEIKAILTVMEERNICFQSSVKYRDWQMIKKVFLEEKLYYDFLYRK